MLAEEVFGFGIYKESKGSGGRFYERCWLMGSEDALYGQRPFWRPTKYHSFRTDLAPVAASQKKAGNHDFSHS